jgi:tetratricopeptide (TPR) repeat protein
MSVALMGFWILRGYSTEGRRYVRAALELPEVQASDFAHAHALYVGAGLADGQGNHVEAKGMLEACLALRRKLGEPVDVAATLSTLSLVRLHAGDAEGAFTGEQEALEIFRRLDNTIGEAIGLLHLGQIHAYVGEEKKAIEHLEQCLAIAQRIKYSEVESECDVNLGELALDGGDTAAASKRFSRALAVCRDAGNKRGESTALWWLGKIDRVRGDLHAARVRLGGALRAFRAYEMHEELLGCLEDHAALWHALGNDAEAARMHAAVDVSRQRLALRRSPRAEARIRATIASLRAAMGDTAFDTAWSAGTRWEIGEAAAEALALAPEEAALA